MLKRLEIVLRGMLLAAFEMSRRLNCSYFMYVRAWKRFVRGGRVAV